MPQEDRQPGAGSVNHARLDPSSCRQGEARALNVGGNFLNYKNKILRNREVEIYEIYKKV